MVVSDIEAAREELVGRGLSTVSEVDVQPWGSFVYFTDPDGNGWAVQQLPDYSKAAGGSGDSVRGLERLTRGYARSAGGRRRPTTTRTRPMTTIAAPM